MYKFLLCWRYLRTRYIALITIVSVMLGVATMIVVNAVMEGFTHEYQERIHGILSDIVVTSRSGEGTPDADRHMAKIRDIAGEYIIGMSPTVAVPAMLSYSIGNDYSAQQVLVIGIDETSFASVSDFGQFLQHPTNREQLSFQLHEGGYDAVDHQATETSDKSARPTLGRAGFQYRRYKASRIRPVVAPDAAEKSDPFNNPANRLTDYDPAKETKPGAVLGYGLCSYRALDGSDQFLAIPGDDVELSYPTVGQPPQVRSAKFTIVDFYESKMSEYDSKFVFVPIRELQTLRGMVHPVTLVANFTAIQIRLKEGVDLDMVRDLLRANFQPHEFVIETWRDKQGAIIAAVQMETAVLNLLLFMIVAVAGFGILAIFFMIVVEKTRDIGILKSLGASGDGIMSIFLCYGLSLGLVGAGVGLCIGLLIVRYINQIADLLGRITGRPVFDPAIYYFQKIPTIVEWHTVTWIVSGAVLIAVLASILPALRAANLHPVKALRYE